MGGDVRKTRFSTAETEAFAQKLQADLEALERILRRPGFGVGAATLGAELEFFLVDGRGRPVPIARPVLARALDPRLSLEIDRFNLEFNASPVTLRGRPFSQLADDLRRSMRAIDAAAAEHGGRVAMIGILPTLTEADLDANAMVDLHRFHALAEGIRRARRGPFVIDIQGRESLRIDCEEVTLEGANTGFQVHLRVPPERFADAYNAAQMATAPALAVSANSPIFLGCQLWEETRIALFRQAVDERAPESAWRPGRVSFGHGWLRGGVNELFAECVALHRPLLPQSFEEDPLAVVARGGVPELGELRLHAGTVWTWNRPVYDPADGGHLRIELRALPAGPTVRDMVASAAFLVGLTLGWMPQVRSRLPAFPFHYAQENFYAAARYGLDAELFWPTAKAPSPRRLSAIELFGELLPVARAGLVEAGVAADEADAQLGVCAARVAARASGAAWQRRTLDRLEIRRSREAALADMLSRYLDLSAGDEPVHAWPEGE